VKIITKPHVEVISTMKFHEHSTYKIPEDPSDAVSIGAFAAKGCYDAYGEGGRPCRENQIAIMEHRHGSVLEHIHTGVFIEGITRALTLELNRHRTFNISQRSTRYTAEEDSAFVLEPYMASLWEKHNMRLDPLRNRACRKCAKDDELDIAIGEWPEVTLVRDHVDSMIRTAEDYEKQVDRLMELNPNNYEGFHLRKWARGKARNVLSHGLETRGTWTNNLRAWRWIIELRSGVGAEPEIRRLCDHILQALRSTHDVYFDDFHISEVYDGIPVWVPEYEKV